MMTKPKHIGSSCRFCIEAILGVTHPQVLSGLQILQYDPSSGRSLHPKSTSVKDILSKNRAYECSANEDCPLPCFS